MSSEYEAWTEAESFRSYETARVEAETWLREEVRVRAQKLDELLEALTEAGVDALQGFADPYDADVAFDADGESVGGGLTLKRHANTAMRDAMMSEFQRLSTARPPAARPSGCATPRQPQRTCSRRRGDGQRRGGRRRTVRSSARSGDSGDDSEGEPAGVGRAGDPTEHEQTGARP